MSSELCASFTLYIGGLNVRECTRCKATDVCHVTIEVIFGRVAIVRVYIVQFWIRRPRVKRDRKLERQSIDVGHGAEDVSEGAMKGQLLSALRGVCITHCQHYRLAHERQAQSSLQVVGTRRRNAHEDGAMVLVDSQWVIALWTHCYKTETQTSNDCYVKQMVATKQTYLT